MKELSDWQALRVRDALRAYHRYERGIEGEYFTWKDVREAIFVYTDVEIGNSAKHGAERLRQFVEGLEDKDNLGLRKYPAPKADAVEAIIAFLTHKDLNLLTEDELKEYVPDVQAHLRLLEFLDDGSETARMIPPENLEGSYKLGGERDLLHFVRELTLQRALDKGLIQIVEAEERYRIDGKRVNIEALDCKERRKHRKARELHGGWAILTPEDNLLCFLKNEETTRNRYYITMAADTGLWSGTPHNRLVLLEHDYPFELSQRNDGRSVTEKKIIYDMKGKMRFFEKINDVLRGEAVEATVIEFPVKKDED